MGRKSKPLLEQPKKPSKRWNYAEEVKIVTYMKETILKGLEIEQPTAKIYYERMLLSLGMHNVSISQITYKVSTLKTSYNEAVQWHKSTGQGVEIGSIHGHLVSICQHYDLLDEIYGCKGSVNPQYLFESASSSCAAIEYTYNSDDLIEYDPQGEEAAIAEFDRMIQASATTDYAGLSVQTNRANSTGLTAATNSIVSTTKVSAELKEDTVGRFKRSLSTIPVSKPAKIRKPTFTAPSTAAEMSSDWQSQRAEAIAEKNRITLERDQREEKWKAEQNRLETEKFAFEKDTRLKELDLKKLEMEKDERLAKMKMEYEYQLKLEISKNKNA